jgi:hypothetical protein
MGVALRCIGMQDGANGSGGRIHEYPQEEGAAAGGLISSRRTGQRTWSRGTASALEGRSGLTARDFEGCTSLHDLSRRRPAAFSLCAWWWFWSN